MTENLGKTSKAKMILAYLIGFCFLWEQCGRISFPSSSEYLSWIRMADLALLGGVLFLLPWRERREYKWYGILLLGVIWIIVTAWIRSPEALEKYRKNFTKTALVLLLCPAIGILIRGRSLKTFLKILTAVWTITYAGLSIAGLYAASQGIQIISYNGKQIIGLNALQALCLWDSYHNTTGALLALSILTAYIGAATAEKRWISVLYLAAVLPMLIGLAMTGSRASAVSMWAGSGAAAAAILQKPLAGRVRKKWLRWLITILLVIVITFLGLLGTMGIRRGYNEIVRRGGVLIPSARAEAQDSEAIQQASASLDEYRDTLYLSGNLSGRERLWQSVFEALKMKPSLLLTGTSVSTTMTDLAEIVPTYSLPQLHNEFLQVLVSTGIPGVLLFIAFLYYAIRASFRLFTDTEKPLWERLLFLPFLCIFLIDQVEALRINVQTDLLGLMMIFTGAAMTASGAFKKPAGGAPAQPDSMEK